MSSTTSTPTSVYRALRVGGPPRLQGLPGVGEVIAAAEQTIEAFWLDTDDLRLAAVDQAVVHRLDTAAGGQQGDWSHRRPGREPVIVAQDPDDAARVPDEVRTLVRAHARGRDLVPIAHTQITRWTFDLRDPDGADLGSVVADEVSAQALGASATVDSWAEFHVSVADADLADAVRERLAEVGAAPATPEPLPRELLGDRVPAPGTPRRPRLRKKATAGDVVLDYLVQRRDDLLAHDPGARRSEPDAVHQMRVATRRMRSALQTFRGVLDRDAVAPVLADLTWLAEVLGAERDQEVIQERIEVLLGETPDDLVLGPVSARLQETFARDHAEAHATVLAGLDDPRYDTVLDGLDALLVNPPLSATAHRRASKVLPDEVARTVRKLDRAIATAVGPGRDGSDSAFDEALHDVRKRAKRARYAAEAVEGSLGGKARKAAKSYKRLQTLLGDHQDTVQSRAYLRRLGGRGHLAGQNGFTFGLWYAHEAATADTIVDALPGALRRVRRW